ncbi:MAG: hypothetical protein AAF492_27975 [Verrucomicrobiota bacterium]
MSLNDHAVYEFVVWLHILAAMAWVGSLVFLVSCLMPAMKSPESLKLWKPVLKKSGLRFRMLGWTYLIALFVSGIFLMNYRGFMDGGPEFWQNPMGKLMSFKVTLAIVVFVLFLVLDFFLSRAAARVWLDEEETLIAPKYQKRVAVLCWIQVLLALVLIGIGVLIVRGIPV